MSSTTSDHIDELEARRKRRERRQPTPSAEAKPPSGAAARELWRDLLAGEPDDDDRAKESKAAEDAEPASVDNAPRERVLPPGDPDSAAGVDAEGVDELVRRVQAGVEAAAAEAAVASERSRPTGTAHLSADAVRRQRPTRRAPLGAILVRGRRAGWGPRPRMAALAVILIAGVAVVVSLGDGGRSRPIPTYRAAVSSTAFGAGSLTALAAIPSTVGAIVRRLKSETAPRKPMRHVTEHPRTRAGRDVARPAQTAHQSVPVSDASASGASSQTPTYTAPPAASTSQSSGATSSSRSSQSAGPTNAGPLGGIGSCVQGC